MAYVKGKAFSDDHLLRAVMAGELETGKGTYTTQVPTQSARLEELGRLADLDTDLEMLRTDNPGFQGDAETLQADYDAGMDLGMLMGLDAPLEDLQVSGGRYDNMAPPAAEALSGAPGTGGLYNRNVIPGSAQDSMLQAAVNQEVSRMGAGISGSSMIQPGGLANLEMGLYAEDTSPPNAAPLPTPSVGPSEFDEAPLFSDVDPETVLGAFNLAVAGEHADGTLIVQDQDTGELIELTPEELNYLMMDAASAT